MILETKELESMKEELLRMKQNLQDHYGVKENNSIDA